MSLDLLKMTPFDFPSDWPTSSGELEIPRLWVCLEMFGGIVTSINFPQKCGKNKKKQYEARWVIGQSNKHFFGIGKMIISHHKAVDFCWVFPEFSEYSIVAPGEVSYFTIKWPISRVVSSKSVTSSQKDMTFGLQWVPQNERLLLLKTRLTIGIYTVYIYR